MPKTFEATRKALNSLADDITVFLSVHTTDHTKPGATFREISWSASIYIEAEGIRFRIDSATDGAQLLAKAKAQLKAERKAKAEPKLITHQPKRLEHHTERTRP